MKNFILFLLAYNLAAVMSAPVDVLDGKTNLIPQKVK